MSKKLAGIYLKKGDIVDVVAPSSHLSRSAFLKGVRVLESWGLQPRFPEDIFGKDSLCAQSLKKRLKYLKEAFLKKDSKIVWCVRGGYGSIHLMPYLERMKRPGKKKIFVGYSDVSSIHCFLNQRWNWPSLHGPMLGDLGSIGTKRTFLKNIVFGKTKKIEFKGLTPLNERAKRFKKIKSRLAGGNLTILTSSLGSSSQLKARGKMLFFEDVGEEAYKVDRMLHQALQAGIFKGAKALFFGKFLGTSREEMKGTQKVQKEFSKLLNIPVFKGLPCGHFSEQTPLVLNTPSELSLKGKKGRLIVSANF